MPRTTITKTNSTTSSSPTAGVVLTMAAADVTNKNQAVAQGRDLVIAHNTGAGAHTVTITSAALNGRLGHITAESIAAGAYKVFGPFPLEGWQQSDGYLYFEADHADVKFGVIKLPG